MTNLLESKEKVKQLERKVANHFGFTKILTSTGQVYPRSIDFELIAKLNALSMPLDNFATNIRLMAGYELLTEGFKKGQTGSSAMPHKMNTRSSERICSFSNLLKGNLTSALVNASSQFEEGDVSCSALRRVILPDVFYTSDGICETTLRVLNEMGIYEKKIEQELNHYLPFLASTSFLMHAVKIGIGREQAHEIIKEYAVKVALELREGKATNDLIQRLSEDKTFIKYNITLKSLQAILDNKDAFLGRAKDQIEELTSEITPYLETRDNGYQGKDIL
jgi:adenylosuccinate lyase